MKKSRRNWKKLETNDNTLPLSSLLINPVPIDIFANNKARSKAISLFLLLPDFPLVF